MLFRANEYSYILIYFYLSFVWCLILKNWLHTNINTVHCIIMNMINAFHVRKTKLLKGEIIPFIVYNCIIISEQILFT